jgi:hypothetical protein
MGLRRTTVIVVRKSDVLASKRGARDRKKDVIVFVIVFEGKDES